MSTATSAARLEACLPHIFHGEGGYTNNRKDPGNWTGGKVGVGVLKGTKYGIAANSFPNLDIVNLTKTQAAEIYRAKYWTTAGCQDLPAGVDLPIFDVSVNSGPSRGRSFAAKTASVAEPVARIKKISATRRAFYQGLSTFKTFGKGWMSRVATIEAAAIRMALAAAGMNPVIIKKHIEAEADISKAKVKTGTTVAGTTAAGGAVSTTAVGTDWIGLSVVAVIVVICLVVVIHFIRAQSERAEAFTAEAQKV